MNEYKKHEEILFVPVDYKEKIKKYKELPPLTGNWCLLPDNKIDLNNTESVSHMLEILNYENSMYKKRCEKLAIMNIFLWIILISIAIVPLILHFL